MVLDVSMEIRRAVDSGKVFFGRKQTEKSILKGNAGLIIISRNAPKYLKEKLKLDAGITGAPVYEFDGTGLELGSVCGKPFVVLCMTVVQPGKSKILSVVQEKK